MEQELARLPEGEKHLVAEDSSLQADVHDAVIAGLSALFNELQPKVNRPGGTPFALRNRTSSIRDAREAHLRGAAANRAAASGFQGLPVMHQMSPGTVMDAAVGDGYHTPRDPQQEPDFVDVLMQRLSADGMASQVQVPVAATAQTGNASATAGERATAVSPNLARAAVRLTSVGCPPLRVDRIGGMLAAHILQSKPTFTDWVESKTLTGAPLREATTDARALDLATQEFGAVFLVSTPAEVLLRRLVSVVLATKLGNYKLSTFLEEIPGESALAELPDSILKGLSERLKLEMKLEQLTAAKH